MEEITLSYYFGFHALEKNNKCLVLKGTHGVFHHSVSQEWVIKDNGEPYMLALSRSKHNKESLPKNIPYF